MSKAINRPEKQGCTPTSSKCVIWNGPDIPCIDLCQGDSIDEVVYKLAEQLCHLTTNVFDISKLDLTCLTPKPTTWTETIQALIDDTCGNVRGLSMPSLMAINENGDIILPVELQYTDENNDLITALSSNDYSAYLASIIVDILNDIANLQSSFGVMNSRMAVIESTVASVVLNQETQNPIPTITSQCASNESPGIQTPIDTAFENFETSYCNMVSVLGTNVEMTNAITTQPSTLNDSFQISDPEMKMDTLSGWVSDPTKIADTLTNMWLTVNDMRNGVAEYITELAKTPCILAMPETLVIDSYDATKAVITWSKSGLAGIQDPTGYMMEVYASNNGTETGNALVTQSFSSSTTSTDLISGYIEAEKEYVVKLQAAYACGFSNFKTVAGVLKGANYLYEIRFADDIIGNISLDCYATPGDPLSATTPFDYTTKRTTVSLYNISTGLEITNAFTQPIEVVVRYENTICGIVASEDVVISIPVGDSVGVYEYVSNNMINCGGELGCTLATKIYTCGVSISNAFTQFDGVTITEC
jgi:hypothetical protein